MILDENISITQAMNYLNNDGRDIDTNKKQVVNESLQNEAIKTKKGMARIKRFKKVDEEVEDDDGLQLEVDESVADIKSMDAEASRYEILAAGASDEEGRSYYQDLADEIRRNIDMTLA